MKYYKIILKTEAIMPRKNPETSLQAYERIKRPGAMETTYKKIVEALEIIGTGNYEQIAAQAMEKEPRIWKRLGELRNMGVIVDTGKRIHTKDGNDSMVYCLFNQKEIYSIDPPEKYTSKTVSASDHANNILRGNLVQKNLF